MNATNTVDDTGCSRATVGDIPLSLIPTNVPVGVGASGDYTCLIW